MRLFIDIGHPAHVHLFRNAIRCWLDRGHEVTITIRDKDLTLTLLEQYGLPYRVASRARKDTIGMAIELVEHDWNVWRAARQARSQILMGTSVSISHVAPLVGGYALVFNEDDAQVARTFTRLAYPLAHAIVTPSCLPENHGKKHVTYDGYQKLAYLHPHVFSPDPGVLDALGLSPDEPYFVLRFVALHAAHDRGEKGMTSTVRQQLVDMLSARGRVLITSESALPPEFEPYRIAIPPTDIHHALYYATLFIGDSQSMAVEAAVLGTPALRCNTFVGRISVLQELEHKYGLTYGFRPDETQAMFSQIEELLGRADLHDEWQSRRARMLRDKIDVTAWMVDFVEHFLDGAPGTIAGRRQPGIPPAGDGRS
ncbi:MAG: DUF354 domain-containing protein [Anaerolineae bacterium]|nr:DUF354 domain-containing protein [Anaerolineae bacterium]